MVGFWAILFWWFYLGDFGHVIEMITLVMWLCLYIFSLLVVRTIICIYLYSLIIIHRYCFVIVFEELYICFSSISRPWFLLLFLTKSIYIASIIRKRYTRLSIPSIVVTYIESLIKVKWDYLYILLVRDVYSICFVLKISNYTKYFRIE